MRFLASHAGYRPGSVDIALRPLLYFSAWPLHFFIGIPDLLLSGVTAVFCPINANVREPVLKRPIVLLTQEASVRFVALPAAECCRVRQKQSQRSTSAQKYPFYHLPAADLDRPLPNRQL